MAAPRQQSQFYRRLSVGLLVALSALTSWAAPAKHAPLPEVPPSGYEVFRGEPFFLLSDASYGSDSQAMVRLEVPGRDFRSYLQKYSGADIVLYRVPQPLEFLKAQKNLHRVNVKANYAGEGLANTLNYLWDSWYKQSRLSWQRILSSKARGVAIEKAPQLQTSQFIPYPTRFEQNPQFKPLPGFELISRFRYPLWHAKTIQPPKQVKLDGSSSEFLAASEGNVMVPLGKLKPGLYLVEAMIGAHHAKTLLFVTDTVAITKNASDQMVVWTAHRKTGQAVPSVNVMWSDGAGVLQSAATNAEGIAQLQHARPEHTYVMGQDAAGGVFISENFYYDSEIYNAKLLAITDRPLYRPGNEVKLKFVGREFKNARQSVALPAADLKLTVFDPNGTPIVSQTVKYQTESGADTSFRLPSNATAGGYEIRYSMGEDDYAAAFRVAEYIKPHFDINLAMNKAEFKTGEPIEGKIQLNYTDGRPVAGANVSVSVRAQQLTMVEGELQYAGLFPVKLEQQELKSDSKGQIALKLPAAKEPSRYVLTLFANEQAAYRVKVTRELLVQRGSNPYRIVSSRHFSQPGETVSFGLQPLGSGGLPPTQWELVRLESQTRTTGAIPANAKGWSMPISQPGSYTLSVKDASGNLLGALSHWVAGDGLQATPGSVEVVFDKDSYQPGENAEALITFPKPVSNALLTLERDKVEKYALLSKGADWVTLTRVGQSQWRARIRVDELFSPNITFSVLYAQNGDYTFQNAGIKVAQPTVALNFKTSKPVYLPGETVVVDVNSTLGGKPVSANLSVSVVDEMVYVLQPEIAPSIVDFFYHPRRNNVRTSASLSFISYDMAKSHLPGAPSSNNYNQRGVKVLERPRRDETDTAAWQPNLKTDANGNARFTFVMPDSLTRWRITGRAMTGDGAVGQRTAYVRSEKPFYIKWTAPARYREQDAPTVDLVAFNQTDKDQAVEWQVTGAGLSQRQAVTLKRGANYLSLPISNPQAGLVTAELMSGGRVVDRLQTNLRINPVNWLSPRQLAVPLSGNDLLLSLPADARNIRLSIVGSAASQFSRVVDELIDYPYGCVEQTASRLIPLALAVQAMGDQPDTRRLTQLLATQRQRLVLLAGGDGVFGWWGPGSQENIFLTGYAYYADWYASRSLGLPVPAENWQYLLEVYKKHGSKAPLSQRAMVLWWANQMGLPVQTLLSGVERDLIQQQSGPLVKLGRQDSLLFIAPESQSAQQLTLALVAQLHAELKTPLPAELVEPVASAQTALRESGSPFVQSLLLLSNQAKPGVTAASLLPLVSSDMPTQERAMALIWLQKSMGGTPVVKPSGAVVGTGWVASTTRSGQEQWSWSSATLPARLQLQKLPAEAATALIRYDSSALEPARLPLRMERRLYVLEQDDKALTFTAKPVKQGEALQVGRLYVDELELTPPAGKSYSYGLLEVPLPPGADVESTTSGLTITGLDGVDAEHGFSRLQHEMGQLSYNLPVEQLGKRWVTRQLLRFSQRGRFTLPPARYFRMYQPEDKAFQGDGKTPWVFTVQ
ncbi:alpha-2-macroglobulin family protein [Leeia aquatica]|uniref:alpha-2-macroglobulin family protein n=1 Tax=Leeia aquatica TaxID=2725557 RepID=UPI00197DB4A9|nr:alpha-2-macroglobulin [Leeia aquatica]